MFRQKRHCSYIFLGANQGQRNIYDMFLPQAGNFYFSRLVLMNGYHVKKKRISIAAQPAMPAAVRRFAGIGRLLLVPCTLLPEVSI